MLNGTTVSFSADCVQVWGLELCLKQYEHQQYDRSTMTGMTQQDMLVHPAV